MDFIFKLGEILRFFRRDFICMGLCTQIKKCLLHGFVYRFEFPGLDWCQEHENGIGEHEFLLKHLCWALQASKSPDGQSSHPFIGLYFFPSSSKIALWDVGGCWGVFGNTFLYYSILTTYSSKVVCVGKLTLMYARMWANHNVFNPQASKSYSLLRFFILLWYHFTSAIVSVVTMCDCNTGFSGWNLMDIVDAYIQFAYAVHIFVFLYCVHYSWMIVLWAIRSLTSVFFLRFKVWFLNMKIISCS